VTGFTAGAWGWVAAADSPCRHCPGQRCLRCRPGGQPWSRRAWRRAGPARAG